MGWTHDVSNNGTLLNTKNTYVVRTSQPCFVSLDLIHALFKMPEFVLDISLTSRNRAKLKYVWILRAGPSYRVFLVSATKTVRFLEALYQPMVL